MRRRKRFDRKKKGKLRRMLAERDGLVPPEAFERFLDPYVRCAKCDGWIAFSGLKRTSQDRDKNQRCQGGRNILDAKIDFHEYFWRFVSDRRAELGRFLRTDTFLHHPWSRND